MTQQTVPGKRDLVLSFLLIGLLALAGLTARPLPLAAGPVEPDNGYVGGDGPAAPTPTPTATDTATATPSTGSVEGKAFYDIDGDHTLDSGEPGIAGAEMVLVDFNTDQVVQTAWSDAAGRFRFDGITPGPYRLREQTPPPGYARSANGGVAFLVQANATFNSGTDFPYSLLATATPTPTTGGVEGTAFWDVNGNDRLDPLEPGVAGAEIVLVNSGGAEAYIAVSASGGTYRFNGVAPGQYTLKEKTAPPGYNQSVYQIMFQVQANVTISQWTNFPHSPAIITPTPTPTTATNTPTPTGTPTPTETPTATATRGPSRLYLPLVYKPLPPPAAPTLWPITAPEANLSYTVSWSAVSGADSYVLQRATNDAFSDAAQVYSGAGTESVAPSAGIATYYYRVKARGASGDSAWSNVQAVAVRWELEPNDKAVDAVTTGALQPGSNYYGVLRAVDPSPNDYFYLDLPAGGPVELWLHESAGLDVSVGLRDANLQPVPDGFSGNTGGVDEHFKTGSLFPGRYYVQVNRAKGDSSQPYSLRGAW